MVRLSTQSDMKLSYCSPMSYLGVVVTEEVIDLKAHTQVINFKDYKKPSTAFQLAS